VPPTTIGSLTPRLLDLDSAGAYCGVKRWTIKEWLRSGILRRVPMPARVVRVDREDLDRLIATWKDGGQ
jgi:predicted site-specific integrase-resolvase